MSHKLSDELRKRSQVVFLACEETVARDLSDALRRAAERIEMLEAHAQKLETTLHNTIAAPWSMRAGNYAPELGDNPYVLLTERAEKAESEIKRLRLGLEIIAQDPWPCSGALQSTAQQYLDGLDERRNKT